MEQFFEFLNGPLMKTLLMLVFGFALKRWGAFLNKAIPLALVALSGALTFVQYLASLLTPETAHAFVAQASVTIPLPTPHQPWWHYLLVSVLLPVVAAIGVHSGTKNTKQLVVGK